MNMNVLDQNGLLPAIQRLMSDIFIPSLKKMDKGWGFLDNQAGQHTREEFINSLESFVGVLVGMFALFMYFAYLLKAFCYVNR